MLSNANLLLSNENKSLTLFKNHNIYPIFALQNLEINFIILSFHLLKPFCTQQYKYQGENIS